jgi:hypothetical protein
VGKNKWHPIFLLLHKFTSSMLLLLARYTKCRQV